MINELQRNDSECSTVTRSQLAVCVAQLNSRIRNQGVSPRELWMQRDQFTHEHLPLNDQQYIATQNDIRNASNTYTNNNNTLCPDLKINLGDLVYLYSDKNKYHTRPRYLVTAVAGKWCYFKKFQGNQL